VVLGALFTEFLPAQVCNLGQRRVEAKVDDGLKNREQARSYSIAIPGDEARSVSTKLS
jgi:hypothetical protein